MWNIMNLQCPTSDIVEYLPKDTNHIESLRDFITVLTAAADTLTCDNPLWKELHVLQNIQAKYRRILHCDKSLIYLHRVSHCLKKMVLLNLSKCYLGLAERFLVGFQNTSVTSYLPSRQQVEYALIRTQSAAKLVSDAIRYSCDTFCFLIQKLKVGHIIIDLVMAASVTARLNLMLKGILVQLCDIYQKVLTWRYKIKEGVYEWLQKLDLPFELDKWLLVSESERFKTVPISKSDLNILTALLKAKSAKSVCIEDTETQQCDSDCFVVDKIENITDYGEVICREEGPTEEELTLTAKQKKVLKKLISAPNFEKLQDIWQDISNSDEDYLLISLTVKKRRIIGKFLSRVRKMLQGQSLKNSDNRIHTAGVMLAKYLGFTQHQIDLCTSNHQVSSEAANAKLQPVRTFKKLRVLFKLLSRRLLAANKCKKHRKLQKIFKQRRADIKLLTQNGEKAFAKKLIKCTSKVILTLYEK